MTQPELAQRLHGAAFFTYPGIYAETFCNAALRETTQGYAELIPVKPTAAELAADFRALLRRSVAAWRADPQGWAAARFA